MPEAPAAAQELGSLEDAAELVVKAVRRLAAGRGESWALKAAVRPLVKRLDPTFDERHFGFGSFTELISALSAYILERSGDYDHELAVRADLDGSGQSADATAIRDAMTDSSPVAFVERQLRRKGLRLPSERQVLWLAPELIVAVFEPSGTGIEPDFDSLRAKLEHGLAEYGFVLSEAEFNKLKTILVRAQVLELHGQGSGMSLRLPDAGELRLRLITVLLGHLADPASEDPGILTEAIFGPGASVTRIVLSRTGSRPRCGNAPRPNQPSRTGSVVAAGSRTAHRPQRLLERSHGGEHCGGFIAAVRHAVGAARVLAAAVGVPVGGLDQLAVGLRVPVRHQVTRPLPAEKRIGRDPPCRAAEVRLALEEVEEQRRVVEPPALPVAVRERLAEQVPWSPSRRGSAPDPAPSRTRTPVRSSSRRPSGRR